MVSTFVFPFTTLFSSSAGGGAESDGATDNRNANFEGSLFDALHAAAATTNTHAKIATGVREVVSATVPHSVFLRRVNANIVRRGQGFFMSSLLDLLSGAETVRWLGVSISFGLRHGKVMRNF